MSLRYRTHHRGQPDWSAYAGFPSSSLSGGPIEARSLDHRQLEADLGTMVA